jgi:hypothetical protein
MTRLKHARNICDIHFIEGVEDTDATIKVDARLPWKLVWYSWLQGRQASNVIDHLDFDKTRKTSIGVHSQVCTCIYVLFASLS